MPDYRRDVQPDPAMEEAVDWFVRRDGRILSDSERADFDSWLAASPAHRAAYAEIERLWSDLERMPAESMSRRLSGKPMPVHPDTLSKAIRRSSRSRSRRWGIAGAAAAGILLLAAFGTELTVRLQADARTGVGEIETVNLPDGSTATLNTASAIAIDYSRDERRVRVLRGEAEFNVSKNATRPFGGGAADGTSTALGTVFVVYRRGGGATVTVLEGQVAVHHAGSDGRAAEAVVVPNQRIGYAAGRGLGPIENVDPRAANAWRRGKLVFIDRALGEVVDELNRYHVGMIRILDESLRSKKVNGVFETRDPVSVVDALEQSLGLDSVRLSSLLILLHR